MNIQENVPLKDYTTLKVGGPARCFVVAKNRAEMIEAHRSAIRKRLPVFFLGSGSNVLVSDKGFEGLVIKVEANKLRVDEIGRIHADAGVLMSDLLRFSLDSRMQGIEWTAGLPGTVAAAVYGNSGCNDGCMADIVEKVWYHDGYREIGKEFKKEDFRYRYSMFKNYPAIITEVRLKRLPRTDDIKGIKEKINKFNRRRSKSQPKGVTAGCIFRNPILDDGEMISAGLVIELAGYKGVAFPSRSVSDTYAEISKKHGNFFLNVGGGAKAFHFRTLIITAKACVWHRSKQILEELNRRDGEKRDVKQEIDLEEEITYLGDFSFRGETNKETTEEDSFRRDGISECSNSNRLNFN